MTDADLELALVLALQVLDLVEILELRLRRLLLLEVLGELRLFCRQLYALVNPVVLHRDRQIARHHGHNIE